jgi:hypothetical protein
MTVLAQGAEKVRALELALAGKPPDGAAEQSLFELKREIERRSERRSNRMQKLKSVYERASAPFRELAKSDDEVSRYLREQKGAFPRRDRKLPRKTVAHKVESQMAIGSSIWIKVPPYDMPLTFTYGSGEAWADVTSGSCQAYTIGEGSGGGSAGLMVSFLATEDNLSQRFAALVEYGYEWIDDAFFFTAHCDGTTTISVWGASENDWVTQSGNLVPSWSDGAGWLDNHGDEGDGTESLQVFFPVRKNNWYFAWVRCDVSSDDTYPQSLGMGEIDLTIPFVVFGSL